MTTRRFASALVLLTALAGAARAQTDASLPDGWLGPGPLHKLIVSPDDPAKAWFEALGAVRTEIDYGAFALLVVDETPVGGQAGLLASGFRFADEQSLIPLEGYRLDGTRPEETLALLDPAERIDESPLLDPLAGLYLVQFVGPVRDEWVAGLQATGARIVQYVAMNGYVVAADPGAVAALAGWRAAEPAVQYLGIWQPGYRLTPALRAAAAAGAMQPLPVTIQLVAGPGAAPLVEVLRQVAASVPLVVEVGPYVNVQADLAPVWFRALAHQPEVFAVGPRGVRTLQDERQGQTVAGNVSGNGPSAPGYLAWLASAGFDSSQFTSFAVNVVDDSTSLTGHPDLASSRVTFSFNPTSQSGSQPGHGFLNAHIVAGFNNGSGSALVDAGSYHYGLGIAPWAQVGSTAIFGAGSATQTSWESTAYNAGARISTNSWTFVDQFQNPIPDYESEAQTYDKIVRDARAGTAGNQEYVVVFAASNNGPGANSVSTPATAKNVITVAASENNRQTGTDGCGLGNSGANNVNDIIDFSSHGPVNSAGGDGRWKPEIAAPGTHIQAGVPQSNYNGSGICNQYFPPAQTLYSWSSGTSHSTPAVAGGVALVRQWFLNHALPASSPAMAKAMLVNSAEYMTGTFANDTLPSNSQGMGRMNLGRAFDTSQRILVDQTNLLASTGASYSVSGSVSDSSKPFRVTLVWTDAFGPTTGAPWVNNLDLSVTVGGSTYLGNVFSGASSATGGSADIRNNTESVFRPAGTSGAFTVTVTAAAIGGDGVPGNGDSTDQDFALVVYNGSTVAAPVANFGGSPTSGVKPLAVSFTDQSTGSITSWAWTFGDGGTSTAQNPSHTYSAAGTFTVALTATGPGGSNTNTKTNYVTVSEPPPVANFSGSPTSGNKPLAVSFTNTTTGVATSWSWTFGDGGTSTAQNPSHTYNTAGTFTVALTATGPGGSNTNTKTNYITVSEPPPVASFTGTPTSGTKPLLVSFTDSSTNATSWSWTFGDGGTSTLQNPGHTYAAAGTYTVALTATGPGGSNTNTKTNYISVSEPAPVADFSGTPTSGIKPLLVSFTDQTTNPVTSWAWTFGDGGTSTAQNPSHTYSAAGTFTVALTATGPGGSNTKTKTAYITVSEPAPVANFSGSPTSGTKPLLVSFTDQSTNPVTSWSWTFGDGGTSTAQNPSHTYAAAGTYTVALTATGPGGSNTNTKTNYIAVSEPAPVADFSGTPTSGIKPLLVSFTDLTTNPVTSWAWTFGDGGTSTAQNPSHTYNAAGTFTVALTATGPGGSNTKSKTAYITVSEPAPVANFSGTPTSGTKPLLVSFTDLTTNPVTSWAWTFGDGGTSTAQNPSHTYNAAGTFTVALTATGPGGSNTLTKTNYVTVSEPAPVANFSGTPTTGTKPLLVAFTDQTTNPVTSWAWTFGDGGTSTAQNPSHTYSAAGTYTVALTATGPGGSNTNTKTNYITVSEPPPVANFSGSPTSGTKPLLVAFTDQTTNPVTSWAWTFGDGGTSTAQNPSHTYNSAGTYTVALTATGPGGNNTLTKTSYVTVSEPAPVANFSGTPTSGTKPLLVSFTDLTTNPVTSWAWTFGDGGTSTAQNPSHTYNAAGTFTVALTATGPGGSDTSTKTNYITVSEPAPVAAFSGTPTSGTKPLLVSFTDSSTNTTSWSWTFGDGGTSTAQNPSHTYNTAGTFTVALTATGPGGSNTNTKTNYITVSDPAPVASFSGTPTSGTKPLLVSFTDSSTNTTSWAWTFGDGGTSTAQNPTHTYTSAGTFTVALTATGPGGNNTLTKTNYIAVSELAPIADFSGTPTSGTKPLLVSFTDQSSNPVTSWSWTFGDGGTSTAQNPSHTYTSAGTFTVALTATGPGGSNTLTKTSYVVVAEPAPIAAISGAPTSGIKPLLVSFTDQSSNPVTSWAWDFGDGGTSTLQNPTHTYTAAGAYTVALTASGPGGTDTDTQVGYVVVSEPAPVADFSGTPTSGAAPLDVAFTDLSTGPIATWAWTFGDGGSSGLQSPHHVYTTGGTFTVSLTVTGPGGTDSKTKTSYVTVTAGAFVPYGTGSGGAAGVPVLSGAGDLTPGSVPGFDLSLTSAPPLAPIILFVGAASASVPLKGQSLLVFPIVTQIGLGATNGAGTMTLHSKVPASTPSISVYLQAWLVDPTGTAGFSSTNGLRLDVP